MTIQDNSKITSAATTAIGQAFQSATQATAAPQQATGLSKKLSFMKLGSIGGLSRAPSSEVLVKAITALTEEAKKIAEAPWSITLLPIDNAKESHLAYSGVSIVVRNSSSFAKDLVAFHTLILEGTSEPLVPLMDNYRGNNFEVQRLTCDAYNEVYHNTVVEVVRRAFNGNLLPADSCVVPRNFNWEDKDAVHQLLLNAVIAGYTNIGSRDPEFVELNLAAIERDSALTVRLNFNEPQKSDYVGLPVRSDIKVSLVATQNQKGSERQVNVQDRSNLISEVSGYIDPIWAPVTQQQFMYGMPPITQKFAARLVMTQMENVALTTIPAQLLALASAMVLRENNNWYPYFSPRPIGTGGRTVDMRDAGALNIEGNLENNPSGYGDVPDTKSNKFTALDLGKMLSSLFQPGMHFSLRISESGADTWYNSVFRAAADGDQNASGAILRAANILTAGHFQRFYEQNENPVVQNLERVHLGYYIAADGAKRDISDIDYLAVMNLVGRQDPTVGAQWTDTFFRTDFPLHQRLSARKKMIEAAAKTEVTFTGFGRLVTFTHKFIDAFAKACAAAGLDIRTSTPSISGDFFSQRAQASYLSQAQVAPGVSGLFNQSFGGQNFQDPRGFFPRSW